MKPLSIIACVRIAQNGQKRAIARLRKNKFGALKMWNLTNYAKTVIDILGRPSSDARFEKGYIMLTNAQVGACLGTVSDEQMETMGPAFYAGKKIICGIDVNILNNSVSIIPIR